MAETSGRAFDFPVLRKVFRFVKPYRKIFYTTVVLTLVLAGLSPLRPWITQYTLDHHVAAGNSGGLLQMAFLMFGLLVLQSFVQFFHSYQANLLGQEVIHDLRVALFHKLLHFRLSYFDRTPIGTIVTREVSDMETIADIFSEGIIVIAGDLIQLAVIIAVMFYTDWQLSLISLSTIPLLLIATNIFKNRIKKTFNDVRTQVARLNSFVQEHLTGMRIVQVFSREKEEMKKFEAINRSHRDANIRSVWYYSIFFPVVEILSAISIGLVVWWGAHGVFHSSVSFGNVVAFIMYIGLMFRPIRELADKFNTLQMGVVSSERIFKILEHDEDEPPASAHEKIADQNMKGHVEFRNVWFAYKDEDWVLKDVSFTVEAGRMAAFVGETGSGKTTIISLLNRFYEIQKGEILVDGINIRNYNLKTLRSRMAVVLQDVFLFSGTIAENISLGDPSITSEQITIAAKIIGIHDFISKLPGGYDFDVMERGVLLSMGQRQLIAFLRAYVRNPSILVLDEATSSIDSLTEQLITNATQILTRNRTSFVIAHRLATVQKADKIIVLHQGTIRETGTHHQLLERNGMYKKLYDVQFSRMAEA